MLKAIRPSVRTALATVALGAMLPLAACNEPVAQQGAAALPSLPATLPLAIGEERPIAFAPPAAELPRVQRIRAVQVAEPDDYYAYAEDAWSYADALGEAPPDYGFYYDDVEPWGWQGYDDSLMFVEPLDAGYRYYYYRPGEEYPYFIRDPDWGYGYDDGALAVIYDALGGILPYDRYDDGPWLDYASTYYDRGYRLYYASHDRHPVLAANWYDVQPVYSLSVVDWGQDLWSQPAWLTYHQRTYDPRERYWSQERARREAEVIRYAAWEEAGFQAAPPPRAIPSDWQRADWARDDRWYAPPARGFAGDPDQRRRAETRERERVAALAGVTAERDRVQLAALRERVARRGANRPQRAERVNQLRRQIETRQAQLASREGRTAERQLAQLERQQRMLASAEQRMARGGGAATRGERFASRQDRIRASEIRRIEARSTAEQPLRREFRDRQRLDDARQQRQVRADLRQQRALERRSQADERTARRQQAQDEGRRREEARRGAEQQRAAREQARQQRVQAETQQRARTAERQQARQAAENQRAARDQARQQRAQAESQQRARAAERQQARQAAEQQRAAREQARQQRAQAESQQQARAAERQQARQAAEQQRAAQREQAREEVEQQQAARSAERQAQNAKGGHGRGRN